MWKGSKPRGESNKRRFNQAGEQYFLLTERRHSDRNAWMNACPENKTFGGVSWETFCSSKSEAVGDDR